VGQLLLPRRFERALCAGDVRCRHVFAGAGWRCTPCFPVVLASLGLAGGARRSKPTPRNWRYFLFWRGWALAVDLRWFESAWPAHLAIFNKMLLLMQESTAFILLRQLEGTGFDLRLPIAQHAGIGLAGRWPGFADRAGAGLEPGFLHVSRRLAGTLRRCRSRGSHVLLYRDSGKNSFFADGCRIFWSGGWGDTPHWLPDGVLFACRTQQAVCRAFHIGAMCCLAVGGGVLLWPRVRQERRVGASAITHASVDAIWSLWLR